MSAMTCQEGKNTVFPLCFHSTCAGFKLTFTHWFVCTHFHLFETWYPCKNDGGVRLITDYQLVHNREFPLDPKSTLCLLETPGTAKEKKTYDFVLFTKPWVISFESSPNKTYNTALSKYTTWCCWIEHNTLYFFITGPTKSSACQEIRCDAMKPLQCHQDKY